MTTVKEATTDFIFHCHHEKGLSCKTQKFYAIDLTQFMQFLVNKNYQLEIEKIDKHILREYLHCISDFKPKTIKRKIATLKAFFNFLEFEDRIVVTPFRKFRIKIKETKVLPTVMTTGEVRKIFQAAYIEKRLNASRSVFKQFESIRNIAVIELLFATGIRVSELSNLKIDTVDLQAGFIKVMGKGRKERIIQVCNKETISVLKEYLALAKFYRNISTNCFFVNRIGEQLSEQSVRYIVKNLALQTVINKRITPHVFRHTIATLLLEEGVDIKYIQDILGHSSIMTTQIYTHVNGEKQKAILRLKHPRRNFTMNPEIVV